MKRTLNDLNRELLTRKQAADLLQIDLSTLWHWTKKGKIRAMGISSKVYYLRQDVMDALIPLNNPEDKE